MAKRRKTREEKILSDIRKTQQQTAPSPVTFSLPSTYKIVANQPVTTQSFNQFYDLQKTLVVSSGIILFQLILFILLKQHIVTLPFAPLQ